MLARQASRKGAGVPMTAVINDVRSLYNVGSIFRTADGAGLEKIWLCGITGIPPSGMISKTALGAENSVPWEYSRDILSVVRGLKDSGYCIVLLEQTVQSIPFQEFMPDRPICLIVGNEVTGISDELLKLCDQALEIEMHGIKNSLNVAVAFGIAAYHLSNGLKAMV